MSMCSRAGICGIILPSRHNLSRMPTRPGLTLPTPGLVRERRRHNLDNFELSSLVSSRIRFKASSMIRRWTSEMPGTEILPRRIAGESSGIRHRGNSGCCGTAIRQRTSDVEPPVRYT